MGYATVRRAAFGWPAEQVALHHARFFVRLEVESQQPAPAPEGKGRMFGARLVDGEIEGLRNDHRSDCIERADMRVSRMMKWAGILAIALFVPAIAVLHS